MKILDLFSGIGGFSLGLERAGFKTVAFCEIDKYCQLILKQHWEGVKIYHDVREITRQKYEQDGLELPEIITGGVPCQPFSVAGQKKGTKDNRHLWPEMFRVIKDFNPRWIIVENVRGIINIEDGVVFESVYTDLANEGYQTQSFIIPASGVGAPHRRERVWIIAHREESMVNSDSIRFEQHNETKETTSRGRTSTSTTSTGSNVAHSDINHAKQSIRKSNGAQNKIQKEYRKENSSSRKSSRAGEVWESNNRYEDVANSRRTSRGEQSSRNKESIRSGSPKETEWSTDSDSIARSSEREKVMADSSSQQSLSTDNREKQREAGDKKQGELGGSYSRPLWSQNWNFEPNVGRVADGVQGRIHRLKGLGNSIVPQIAEEIGRAILKAEYGD